MSRPACAHPGAWRRAALALALAACFERGGKDRREPPPPPVPARPPTLATGWLAREPAGAPDAAAVLRVALEAEPATLDPFATLDAASGRVLGPVVEGLVCPTGGGAVEPCVARSYTASADGRTWRFTLDPRRRFSDGRAVTAADVVASLDASRGVGHPPGPLGFALDDATAIRAVAPDVVEVVTREARRDRLRDLALVPIVPAPQLAAPALAERPVGTGPLAIERWTRGEVVRLVRVPGAARSAGAAAIELVVVADRADAIRRLAAGSLDVALQVPVAEAIDATAAHAALARFRYQQPAYLAAVFNCRRAALADPQVRRALIMTLDRDGVAAGVLGGAPTLRGPWLPGAPEDDPALAPLPFAPTQARELRPPPSPALRLLVPAGSTSAARIADIWAADAAGAFALTVEQVPFADLLARLGAGDFDVAITSLSAGPEVDPSSRLASDAPADQAWSGLRDAELDRALAAWRAAATDAARAEAGRAVQRRVAALAPMAYIAVDTRAGLARAGVGGLLGDGRGAPPLWRLWRARP